jgi:circadian clock protein KaiB
MKRPIPKHATKGHGPLEASRPLAQYLLRLYVAGTSSRSRQAILRARELCASELHGHCRLEVIDIYQDPVRARNEQIVATPTLVKEIPLPARRVIGTPAKSSRLFVALGFEELRETGT